MADPREKPRQSKQVHAPLAVVPRVADHRLRVDDAVEVGGGATEGESRLASGWCLHCRPGGRWRTLCHSRRPPVPHRSVVGLTRPGGHALTAPELSARRRRVANVREDEWGPVDHPSVSLPPFAPPEPPFQAKQVAGLHALAAGHGASRRAETTALVRPARRYRPRLPLAIRCR